MAKLSDVVPRSEAREELDERLSQRFIALDPKGYFLIKVDSGSAELVLGALRQHHRRQGARP
jgi:hypothetical protein